MENREWVTGWKGIPFNTISVCRRFPARILATRGRAAVSTDIISLIIVSVAMMDIRCMVVVVGLGGVFVSPGMSAGR